MNADFGGADVYFDDPALFPPLWIVPGAPAVPEPVPSATKWARIRPDVIPKHRVKFWQVVSAVSRALRR